MHTRPNWLLFFCLLGSIAIKAQQVDSAYYIYQQQFIDLSTTRSVSEMEARQILKKFDSYKVSSNKDMARLLNSLYPQDKGVGILLYLYTHDSLKRTFFEPGKIIEEATIPVTAAQMFQLGDQLHTALELQKLAANRQPVERGLTVKSNNSKSTVPPLDSIIQQLTNILLPAKFSNQYRHLVVIPALNIGTLPFHLLKPYGNNEYLIDECSFTVAPTLIDFVALRMKAVTALYGSKLSEINTFINLPYSAPYGGEDLNWQFSDGLFVSNPSYPQDGKYTFPDLPGAAKEVDSVTKYYQKPVVYKGGEATKQHVLNSMNGKEVAYFATHGISSPDNPKDNSYVVLSGNDPFLTSKQIMDLRLDTSYHMPELVVLSACQTALGKSMEAGVSGSLARSFILAGSKHVVTSLWSVDDEATAYMMSRFMYYLKQPHPFTPSEPLRLATIDTKKRFPKPAYWASFILLGIDY